MLTFADSPRARRPIGGPLAGQIRHPDARRWDENERTLSGRKSPGRYRAVLVHPRWLIRGVLSERTDHRGDGLPIALPRATMNGDSNMSRSENVAAWELLNVNFITE
jgi:hypothetical protein